MLSKGTRVLSTILRASSHVKLANSSLLSLYKPATPTPNLAFQSLFSMERAFFSNSSRNNSDEKDPEDPASQVETKEKTTKPRKKRATQAQTQTETFSEESLHEHTEVKLQTVPIKPVKFPLEKGEEKLKPETFVLFSSKTPIVPYSQQTGFVNTGNLNADQVSHKSAFFMQNEAGEIYRIGLVLEDRVNKSLKMNMAQTISDSNTDPNSSSFLGDDKNRHKTTITTRSKNYKVKLIEIEIKDNCIFAKAIPYVDTKPSNVEKTINMQNIVGQIKNLVLSIRQAVAHEKIDGFNNSTFDLIYNKKVEMENLDEFLSSILGECVKLSTHTKENIQTFVQVFLEQKSLTLRMFLIKKKLEEIKSVLEIVNSSSKYADEQIWKFHEQAKARLSLEYIRSNFFSGENVPPPGAKPGATPAQGTGTPGAEGTPLSGQAKKFMEKLPLIPDEVARDKIRKEIEKFSLQDKMSGEYHKLYAYLDEVFSVPWGNLSEEYWNIEYSKQVLEERLFGLHKVKERIVEMIAVNKLKRALEESNEKKKGFVILLNGPPGTGKTTIAKSIADALKRESRFISFAGVTDPAFVKGHKRTYVDAQPGVFVRELIKSKVMNPVLILDEVDKLSKNFHGVDPYYALMEILNPEENCNFTDHYLDIKVDFSQVIFVLTSNQALNMLEPLRNRLEIIEVPAYIEQEKLTIAKNYLVPEVLREHGLPADNIVFTDETVSRIIKGWCYYESGVRELRRCLEKITRKHALEILNTYKVKQAESGEVESQQTPVLTQSPTEVVADNTVQSTQVNESVSGQAEEEGKPENNAIPLGAVDAKEVSQLLELKSQVKLVLDSSNDPNDELLKKYLGNPVFDDMYERRNKKPFIGTANVLTVSGFIGHVMTVECIYDPSSTERKGILTSSGNLQNVLQESLTIARLVAFKFLPQEKIKEITDKNVHIHFLEGGAPKDGPSAGISICSAFLSLMLNKPIPQDLSMTGELSLHGDVCKIGGVQAKVTASKALDIKRIILPWGNKTEFFELPKMLKEGLTVYFVKEYQEVYNIIFGESPEAIKATERFEDGRFIEPIAPVNIQNNLFVSVKNN